jgi:hypothetical protein
MTIRKAGDNLSSALYSAGFGTMGAIAANAVAHDDMDYMADDLRHLNLGFDAMSSDAQDAYIEITAKNKLSGLDRALVSAALRGEIGPPKGIGTEGDRAVAQAAALRQQAPEIAAEVEQLNKIELELIAKEIDFGTTPQAVMGALEYEGAGVTPHPAVAGGFAAGLAGALAARRRY